MVYLVLYMIKTAFGVALGAPAPTPKIPCNTVFTIA